MLDSLFPDSVLDNSTIFLCVLDTKGTILSVNSRFARILGDRSRQSLIGMNISDTVRGNQELTAFFNSLIPESSENFDCKSVLQPVHRNAEKTVWIQFDISLTSSVQYGKCFFLSGSDVTEHIVARKNAEQIDQERSSFFVKMGHEIKTPLNTVLGYAQLLNSLDNLSPVAKEYAATIIENENSLLHLLNDLFELTKYDAGQTTAVLSQTDTRKLFQETVSSWSEIFANKMLYLDLKFKGDIPESIETDAAKIKHIVSNILGNSLKFTRKGGVTVTVSYDGVLSADIEDSGIGIDAEDQEAIFSSQSQSGLSRGRLTGNGLGLVVARIFARMLGGDVVLVRSSPGNGSHFKVLVKARATETVQKTKATVGDYALITGISKPCKVLLVDDVDINLAMLEIFLAPAGFTVSIALNGIEAVEKFKSFKPDIVFMDLIMPEKDGFEATREIKTLNSSVPVIALTASIADRVKEQALAAGVNDFMSKPFVPERFFEIIADHTGIAYQYKHS